MSTRALRVLTFADTRFPIERANGVQTMATCRALAARGHAVTLLVRPDTHTPARDPYDFYGVPRTPTLTIETITPRGGMQGRRAHMLWSALRRALAGSLTGGIDVVFTRDLGLAALLARVPKAQRPRLVYESHGIAPVVSASMPALLGRPQLAPSARKIARLDRRESVVWTRADAYVTITQTLADDLAERYGPRDPVWVVPDGAPPAASVDRSSAPGRRIRAAYAGHLYPWKGVDVFLEALAEVPDVDGLIVGGHPGEADLARVQARAATLGLESRLTITGLLPPPAVAAALAEADLLILPNTATAISERYTSPLKLFEYLAAGGTIIASDLPAIREVLTHDESAWLVPAGDARALAEACRHLAADPAARRRLGDAALALSAEYTWDRRAERLERALETTVT